MSGGLPHGDEKLKNAKQSVKEAARKDKNSNACFDSNVNRDGVKEGEVAMTVVRIKC